MYSNINRLKILSRFWIVFFPIASYYFYMYVGFNLMIVKTVYFIAVPITLIIVFPELLKTYKNRLYSGIVRTVFLLMIISIIISFVFWDQNLMLSYRVTASYLAILYFFFLTKAKPSLIFLEKTICFFCILYLVLWMYGLFKAPDIVFGLETENGIDNARGIYRLSVLGKGFVILAFFFAISKFVETSKKYWIIIFALLFVVIVMHVIRQIIVISFLVSFYYLLKKNRYLWLWVGFASILLIPFVSYKVDDNTLIGKLIALSENQIEAHESGEENIRISEYRYFFTEYSKNAFTALLGNGIPHSESIFGKRELKINKEKKYFASDVGYAEIYMRFGLVGLFLYALIFYRVIIQVVPKKYMYAKLFMLYILISNVTASWIFQDVIVICICLYILETSNRKKHKLTRFRTNEIFNRNTRLQSKLSKRMY